MTSSLILEDFRPEDRDALLAVKREVFASLDLEAEKRRFEWEFAANPAAGSLPVARVLKDGSRIAGSFAFVPYRVQMGQDVVQGAAGIDLFLAAADRGHGHAHRLVAPFWAPGFCAFPFSTGLNAASQHLFTSCGGVLLGGAAEVTAHAYFVEGDHPERPPGPAHEASEVTAIPSDYEELWRDLRRSKRLIVVRDTAYLRWRYLEFPFQAAQVIRSVGAGRTSGLAVLQSDPDLDRLYLLELLTRPDDEPARRGLLRAICARADRSGQKTLYYSTRAAEQLSSLREAGFVPLPGDIPTYIGIAHHQPAGGVNVRDWYVSLGDGDQLFNVGG